MLILAFLALPALAGAPVASLARSSFTVSENGRQTTPVSREFPASGLKALELRVSAGIMAIARADTDRVAVTVTPKRFAKTCGITVDVKNGRVLVHVREKRKNFYDLSWGQDSCEADVTVRMPQHLAIDAAMGSGTLAATGISAKLQFQSGTGSLRLKDFTGPLEAKLGMGDVEAEGLREPARVKTGMGKIRLVWLQAPASGEIRAETGTGAIELVLPPGTLAQTSLRTGIGQVSSGIASEPEAPLKITVKSGTGDITIK